MNKKLDKVDAFLTRNASLPKEKVLIELGRRFKFSYKDANRIYIDWREKYVTGHIEDKAESKVNSLELYAERYAKRNKNGYSAKEIINIVGNINKYGIAETSRVMKIDKTDITTVYCNAKGFGFIKPRSKERASKHER